MGQVEEKEKTILQGGNSCVHLLSHLSRFPLRNRLKAMPLSHIGPNPLWTLLETPNCQVFEDIVWEEKVHLVG